MMEEYDLDKQGNVRYRSAAARCIGITELLLILISVTMLLVNSSDCERPLRTWLYILIGVLGTHLLLLLAYECFSFRLMGTVIRSCYVAINIIVWCFFFLWILAGTMWTLDESNDCPDKFPEGYNFILVVIILYFSLIGITLLFCLAIVCISSVGRLKTLKLMKDN